MAAWPRGEERGPERRQWKRGADEMDKVEVPPGVTVGSVRRFGATLVGPTKRPPKRRRLRLKGSLRTLRIWSCICYAFIWVQMRGTCDPDKHRKARGSSVLIIPF